MHGEVLTLSMDQEAMAAFVADSPVKSVTPVEGPFTQETVQRAFTSVLRSTNDSESEFRLRLAQKEDLSTISRLVQGLADYVKEPDSIEITSEEYDRDGFLLNDPLWYCLLVGKVLDDGSVHTCGYAFIFVGYVLGQGRFVYLEDLFLEVAHRGGGGGKLTMKTLAGLCRALQCTRLYWQALDWNTAGLSFYRSIGAKIHDGEKTSRYAGDSLKLFAETGTGSKS